MHHHRGQNCEDKHAHQTRAFVCSRRHCFQCVCNWAGLSSNLSDASREDHCAPAGGLCSRHPTSTNCTTTHSAMGAAGCCGKSSWWRRNDWCACCSFWGSRRLYAVCSPIINFHNTTSTEREASFRCQQRPDPL